MDDDRRSKPRLSVSLDASWDRDHPARVTNLSEGGCYLDTVGEVMRGEIVGFRVLLPDGDFLYVEGRSQALHRGGWLRRAVCRPK